MSLFAVLLSIGTASVSQVPVQPRAATVRVRARIVSGARVRSGTASHVSHVTFTRTVMVDKATGAPLHLVEFQ